MTPELAQSLILAVGTAWMLHLAIKRGLGKPMLFSAMFLGCPSVALFLQAIGLVSFVEPGKWAVVAVDAALTVSMIVATRKRTSPVVVALAHVETVRAKEAVARAARRLAEQEHRAELRGEVYVLAGLVREQYEEPTELRAVR